MLHTGQGRLSTGSRWGLRDSALALILHWTLQAQLACVAPSEEGGVHCPGQWVASSAPVLTLTHCSSFPSSHSSHRALDKTTLIAQPHQDLAEPCTPPPPSPPWVPQGTGPALPTAALVTEVPALGRTVDGVNVRSGPPVATGPGGTGSQPHCACPSGAAGEWGPGCLSFLGLHPALCPDFWS